MMNGIKQQLPHFGDTQSTKLVRKQKYWSYFENYHINKKLSTSNYSVESFLLI